MTDAGHPAAPLFAQRAAEIRTALEGVLDGRPVALVNFPNHGNPGDAAIWVGARRVLADLGVAVAYQASWLSYSTTTMQAALPEGGPVLLTGGGNFGDLYRNQQQTRERVLAEATDRRVVQLPQTIDFTEDENLQRNRALCDAHPDLILMVRERASLERAGQWFEAPVQLVPDLAFALAPHDRPAPPETDVLWLARDDVEAVGTPVTDLPAGFQRLDWLGEVPDEPRWAPRARRALTQNRRLTGRIQKAPAAAGRLGAQLAQTFDPLAEAWVDRGERILARGRVVITDRLHGHLLALRCGIPHVAMANATGKVQGVHEAFTRESPLTRWAGTPEEAVAAAHDLLGGGPA